MGFWRLGDQADGVHIFYFFTSVPLHAPITNDNMEPLTFLLICMVGELGELANCVKKIVRGDFPLDAKITEIEEEIADIFIYLVKICNQMNLDLEELFLRKIELNRKRFSNYTR